jgi:pentatricopeptide repeat protein
VVVAGICRGLAAYVDHDHVTAASALLAVDRQVVVVGGSEAQREIVEETLLHALVRAGWFDAARAVLERRLDRRTPLSPC